MTLQNRVLPTGDIVALDFRGDLMGNRGVLHDDNRTLGASRWKMHAWVTCVLDFKGRARTVMTPNRYTELFFLDEASAFAAGHRPCGECRRDSYLIFRGLWEGTFGEVNNVKDIDRRMHQDRVRRGRSQVRFTADPGTLPDGCFILEQGEPWLVWGDRLVRSRDGTYDAIRRQPSSVEVQVLTPACTVRILAAGYRPHLHQSAQALLTGSDDG